MSTTKLRPPKEPKTGKFPRKAVPCDDRATADETGRNVARLATSPEIAAYRVINASEHNSSIGNSLDLPSLLDELRDQAMAVNRGDMAQTEAMLINQAVALQSLFARLAEHGMSCDYRSTFESYMRMALRAQSQCRATLETLAALKNPQPMAFVKQANIAHNQQINNGVSTTKGDSCARENKNRQNELMGKNDGERLDPGTPGKTSNADPAMATLEPFNRTKNAAG